MITSTRRRSRRRPLRYKAIKPAPSPPPFHRMCSITGFTAPYTRQASHNSPLAGYPLAALDRIPACFGPIPFRCLKSNSFFSLGINHPSLLAFHLIEIIVPPLSLLIRRETKDMKKGSKIRPSVWPCWLQMLGRYVSQLAAIAPLPTLHAPENPT